MPRDGVAAAAARLLWSHSPMPCSRPPSIVDGSDPQFTFIHYKAGEARDVPLLKAGNLATPGDIVPQAFSRRPGAERSQFQPGIGPAGTGGEDLQRRGAAGRAGHRQPRLGLALRQAAGGNSQRLRRARGKADASGIARRSGRAFHPARLVAEVAPSRDRDLRHLPPGEPAARGGVTDRRREYPALANESAAARYRGVSRHLAAPVGPAERTDVRPVRGSAIAAKRSPHGLWPRQPRSRRIRC